MQKKRKKYSGRDVVCPYFKREEEKLIVCMSWESGQWVQLRFQDAHRKLRHKRRFCNGFNYAGCPYAQAAEMAEMAEMAEETAAAADEGAPSG